MITQLYCAYDDNFKKIAEGTANKLADMFDISDSSVRYKVKKIENGLLPGSSPYFVKKESIYDNEQRLKGMMAVKRKATVKTYYLYDAETNELLIAGDADDVGDYCNTTAESIRLFADDKKTHRSNNKIIKFYVKSKDGIYPPVKPTKELKDRSCIRGSAKFVEVFPIFRNPRNKFQKNWMKNHFSIVNLDKVDFELESSFKDGVPYRINFFHKGDVVYSEKFYDKRLAYEMLEYLKNFRAKETYGEFYFDGVRFDAPNVVCLLKRNTDGNQSRTIIRMRDGNTTRSIASSPDKHLQLLRYVQGEFIR